MRSSMAWRTRVALYAILLVGAGARLLVAFASRDSFMSADYQGLHDIKAWVEAGQMVLDGRNPYAESYILDFGPVWAWMCAIPVAAAGKLGIGSFGASILIRGVLAAADAAILILIAGICARSRRNPLLPCAAFFLNPVSIFVTGYQGQFDNVSMLPVVMLAFIMSRAGDGPWIDSRGEAARTGLLIGISAALKHSSGPVLLFMTAMFSDARKFALAVCIAVGLFTAVFVPYAVDGGVSGILGTVFGQQQRVGETGWDWLGGLAGLAPPPLLQKILWLAAILVTALLARMRGVSRIGVFTLYYVTILLFVPSFGRHYLLYPIVFGALTNPFLTGVFTLCSISYLLSSHLFAGQLALFEHALPTWPVFLVLASWWLVLLAGRKGKRQ